VPGQGQLLPGLYCGAAGLVLATVAVNLITCGGLLLALQARLGGLPLRLWWRDTLLLFVAAVLGGLAAWGLASGVAWPTGLWGRLLECGFAGGVGLLVYGLVASLAGVPEVTDLILQLRAGLPRLGPSR
jgi:putative peptidoglycan lipid II flippase